MQSKAPRYRLIKKILTKLGYYDVTKHGTASSKNSFLRKFWHFLGAYPNPYTYHFYFEYANSFMAPKMYEFQYMMKKVELCNEDVVLDIGCGEGSLTFMVGRYVQKVVGVDILPDLIDAAELKKSELSPKMNAEFHCNRLENINFREESFDKIVSFSVIEHIPNYLEIFALTHKLLKKDGELIVSVDSFSHFDKRLREKHEKTFDVAKYFETKELHDLLVRIGYREVVIEPIFISKFSEKWFRRVVENPRENFEFHKRLYSFFVYFVISFLEKKAKKQKHGIFLVAKCKK